MKHNVALKKNVSITINYFKDFYGKTSFYVRELNGYKCNMQFRNSCKENLETALNYKFEINETKTFIIDTYVKKDVWYINDVEVLELGTTGMFEVSYAFAKTIGFNILVNKDNISWGWSYGLGKHIQNLSGRIEDVKVEGTDYAKVLKELKNKYSKKLEKNCMYVFEIIEYRGSDKRFYHNDNRLLTRESVGYEESNFDEDIWNEINKR